MNQLPQHRLRPAALLAAIFLFPTASAGAIDFSPPGFELGAYRFIADADDATALFLNPAGLGRPGMNLYLDVSGNEDRLDEWVTALQGGSWGFAYRHRELRATDTFVVPDQGTPFTLVSPAGNLDSYILATSVRTRWIRAGVARVWTKTDLPGEDASAWSFGIQSRPVRSVSIGAVVENANQPEFRFGEIPARYRYGLSVRPLPGDPEFLTLSVEGSHLDGGGGRVDLAYGVGIRVPSGVDLSLTFRDPNGESPHVGLSVTGHFGHNAAAARVRSVPGPEGARGQVSLQIFDEFWRRSVPSGKRVATLELRGVYEDEGSGFVLLGSRTKGALEVVRRIRHAALDPDARGLAIKVRGLAPGFVSPVSAQHEEIRRALLDFRRSGKPVVVFLEARAGAPEVFLASAADRVIMPPLTGIQGIGVSLHVNRLKGLFDKIGVGWDADTAGTYKSTFHTWYTEEASPAQRAQIEGLVEEAYRHLTEAIRDGRKMTVNAMLEAGTGRILYPEECVELGLVDALGWWEDALEEVDRLAGGQGKRPSTRQLPHRRYRAEWWAPPPAVAIVPVGGAIRLGQSGRDWVNGGLTMGAETVARQLRAAAAHPDVRALVFRIDSGGGSSLASEMIRKEILDIKQKYSLPVYVSMGSFAASGGYWISMDADTIVANRSTLTGSIGVVWSVPVLEELYKKVGIRTESYTRGEFTDMFSPHRRMTQDEVEMLDEALDYIYDKFVDGVVEGRGLSEDKVRELGEGRVYFGREALENGLVDVVGTLEDTIRLAATRAGIEKDYRVLTFRPRSTRLIDRVLGVVKQVASLPGGDAETVGVWEN